MRLRACRPLRRTFGLFVLYPAMFIASARHSSSNAALLPWRAGSAALSLHQGHCLGRSPQSSARGTNKYKPQVVAGPAGPLSCSSMRLQIPVCAVPNVSRAKGKALPCHLGSMPLVCSQVPGLSVMLPSRSAGQPQVNTMACQAGAFCSPGRPNPSVKGTACAKAHAAPYLER
jgi:hypothetical protein